MRYFLRKKIALSIAISNLIIVISIIERIRGTYSATERYMMICDNDWGQSGWSATERDFDDWNIRQYEWNQSLPGVSSVTIDKCESSTNGGGGWKL